jgi:hypothetical protein
MDEQTLEKEQMLQKELSEYLAKHRDEAKAILAEYQAKFPTNRGWLNLVGKFGEGWKELFKEKHGE